MSAFVCGKCGEEEPKRHRQFHQRLEIRRADGLTRPHARTIGNLCKACVDAIVAGTKAPLPEPML